MAQPTVAQLRAALKTNIETLRSTTDFNFQVIDKTIDSPTPPTIMIKRGPVNYDLAMQRGLDEWTFIVQALVGSADDQGAQIMLDHFVSGSYTLKDAIESDGTLGGLVGTDCVRVVKIGDEKLFGQRRPMADTASLYLGSEWTVQVFAAGS